MPMATDFKFYLSGYKLTSVPRLSGSINTAPRPSQPGIRRLLRKKTVGNFAVLEGLRLFQTLPQPQ